MHDTGNIDESALQLQEAMMREAWAGRLDGMYRISAVTSTGMMYFNWLALLDTNVIVILLLMGLVSGFTPSIIIIHNNTGTSANDWHSESAWSIQ